MLCLIQLQSYLYTIRIQNAQPFAIFSYNRLFVLRQRYQYLIAAFTHGFCGIQLIFTIAIKFIHIGNLLNLRFFCLDFPEGLKLCRFYLLFILRKDIHRRGKCKHCHISIWKKSSLTVCCFLPSKLLQLCLCIQKHNPAQIRRHRTVAQLVRCFHSKCILTCQPTKFDMINHIALSSITSRLNLCCLNIRS